jgi:Flp pilus assembly protein TadG
MLASALHLEPIVRWDAMTGSRRRGAALAEFALCFPLLVMLLSAAIEYGFVIYNSMVLQDAAREGARWAAKGEGDAQVTSRVMRYFPLRNISAPQVTIQEFTPGGVLITPNQRVPGSSVRVTVGCSVQWLTPLEAVFGGTPFGLAERATFRVENL